MFKSILAELVLIRSTMHALLLKTLAFIKSMNELFAFTFIFAHLSKKFRPGILDVLPFHYTVFCGEPPAP